MSEHNFLILGANGQLGKAFNDYLNVHNITFFAPPERDCDITHASKLEKIIEMVSPTAIINCAAYNAVDDAEEEEELATMINCIAVEKIAEICNRHEIKLIHYSTDYVFDGTKGDVYTEEDRTSPLNVYGQSKLAGEQIVREKALDFVVFRTSWVFGNGTQNFIYKLRQWAKVNKVLKISCDEVSVPTFVDDIVNVTIKAIEEDLVGLFHLTNTGYASRYEWARHVMKILNTDHTIIPVPMNTFPCKAKRPLFVPMSNEKLSKKLEIDIPHWKASVKRYLQDNESYFWDTPALKPNFKEYRIKSSSQ
jgi:dTDP-4-dehydrorhamnose reductase